MKHTEGQPLLEARRVAKAYGRNQVLKDASFALQERELLGVVGENGSGKTTLLKILVGLLAPDAGTVVRRGRVGYCPQEPLVFERLTVRENMHYFATAYGLCRPGGRRDWEAAKDDWLHRFGFAAYEHVLVAALSGGTRQKLNLVLALLHDPDVLILDEPYSGFDWETYLHFWEAVTILRARGTSILVVSHLVYDRSRFDRVFALKNGVLICE